MDYDFFVMHNSTHLYKTTMGDYFITTFNETPLTLACSDVNYAAVVETINGGENVNQGNNNGETPLIQAARHAYKDEQSAIKIINLLLDSGADVDAQTLPEGETALMRASYYGSLHVVKLLLSRGADVNLRAHDGYTVLLSLEETPSLVKRRKRIIKLLEEAGGIR